MLSVPAISSGATPDNQALIAKSLRFRSSATAYMTRTFASAGNRDLWSFSFWVKRGILGSQQWIFGPRTGVGDFTTIEFTSTDELDVWNYVASVTQGRKTTTRKFRDPKGWYHILVVWDSANATADDRIRIYVNGTRESSFGTSSNPSSGQDSYINNNIAHSLGRDGFTPTFYCDMTLAEVHFLDGTAATPDDFGELSNFSQRWQPIAYAGSWGTRGFYLHFTDTASTSTLGDDLSGNGNDFTTSGFSLTAGTTYDSMVDSPSVDDTQSDTGAGGEVAGNYMVLNPTYQTSGTVTNGGLTYDTGYAGAPAVGYMFGTAQLLSGKWYWEVVYTSITGDASATSLMAIGNENFSAYYGYLKNGQKNITGSASAYGATYTANDVIGFAWDIPNTTLTCYKNGVSQGVLSSSVTGTGLKPFIGSGSSSSGMAGYVNFGQRPFAYAAPSGYKAVCTSNIADESVIDSTEGFNRKQYGGTGASNAISGIGHSPDIVLIHRSDSGGEPSFYDSTRGTEARLEVSSNAAEATADSGVTAFGGDGFTVGTLTKVNATGGSFQSWCWNEGSLYGVEVVGYSGNNTSNRNISHSLGVAPRFAIVKSKGTGKWYAWHTGMTGATYFHTLDTLSGESNTNTPWGTGNWSSTDFMVTNNGTNNLNAASTDYIAYLFAPVAGFSSFGTYTGNASANGPHVAVGFRPAFVMVKSLTNASYGWRIFTDDYSDHNEITLSADFTTTAVPGPNGGVDFTADGFKIRSSNSNVNVATAFMYVAFARCPFKYSNAR